MTSTSTSSPTSTVLHELTVARPEKKIFSVHLRTDPRDPDNTTSNPGWLVELRNGIREIGDQLESSDDRESMLAFREFAPAFEQRVRSMVPAQRGRSVSIFTTLEGQDGPFDRTVTSHLPLTESVVCWDERPFITPLLPVVDHGRPMLIAVIDADEAVFYRWTDGQATCLDDLTGDLDAWRDSLPGGEGRPGRLRTHEQQVDARADEHARRFLTDTAARLTAALPRLEVEGIVLIAAPGTASAFVSALPHPVQGQVVATMEAHLTGLDPTTLSERLTETMADVWRSRGEAVADRALGLAAAQDAGAAGVTDVRRALAEQRIATLVVSSDFRVDDQETIDTNATSATSQADLATERFFEEVTESGARIVVLPDYQPLVEAGGVAALLRW